MAFNDRYQTVRDKLDKLGFHQPLSFESLSLVSNLVSELQSIKESLEQFKNLAESKKDGDIEFENGLRSLKSQNERLLKENEHLKGKISLIQEEDGNIKKDLRLKVLDLENKISDLEFVNAEQLIRINELEDEIIKYSSKHPAEYMHSKAGKSQSDHKKINHSQLNELSSVLLNLRQNNQQEYMNLRVESENLRTTLDDYRSKIIDKDNLIKNLSDEVKQLRKVKSIYKNPCTCHDRDKHSSSKSVTFGGLLTNKKNILSNFNRYSTNEFMSSDDTDSGCNCSSYKNGNDLKSSNSSSASRAAGSESQIAELRAQLKSETNIKEELSNLVKSLREEKLQLVKQLETGSKAELEIIHQVNDLFKENVVLRGQIAALEEAKKNTNQISSLKRTTLPKSFPTSTRRGPDSSKEEKENQPVPNKTKDIENIVKDQVEIYMKNMKDSSPTITEKQQEKEEPPKKQFLNTILQERDHFYCQFQKLRSKVCSVLKKLRNIPSFDCPFACIDQITYVLSNYEKRIEDLSTHHPLVNQTQKIQCNCANTDLTAVIKSYEIKLMDIEAREMETSSLKEMLTMKLHSSQEECVRLKSKIDNLSKENMKLKSKCNHINALCEEAERSLRNAEDNKKMSESELNCALSKIKKLECQKSKLENNQISLEFEKNSLKKNLVHIDKEKDLLTIKLDEKTEKVVELEGELKSKKCKIRELEDSLNNLEQKFRALQKMHSHSEVNNKMTEKKSHKTKSELQDLRLKVDNLTKENRRLQDDLSAALRDSVKSNHELSDAKEEIEELKEKLQSYVFEVRRIEDLLQSKEEEREYLLDQLKGLNMDTLSTNSKSLGQSSNIPAEAVSDLQDRLLNYEAEVQDKNNMLLRMKEEIEHLKLQVKYLESELTSNHGGIIKSDVNEEDLSRTQEKVKRLEDEREQLQDSLSQLRKENSRLHNTLQEAQCSTSILEDTLSRTRRETLEEAAKNQSLSRQVKKLEQMILQLKDQLDSAKGDFYGSGRTKEKSKKIHKKVTRGTVKNDLTW